MFAIVQCGSSQFNVKEGDTVSVDRIADLDETAEDKELTLDKVLFWSDGETSKIGKPYVSDVTVKAKIIGHKKDPKVIAFKYRRRKSSATKKGHRHHRTVLNITKIA